MQVNAASGISSPDRGCRSNALRRPKRGLVRLFPFDLRRLPRAVLRRSSTLSKAGNDYANVSLRLHPAKGGSWPTAAVVSESLNGGS